MIVAHFFGGPRDGLVAAVQELTPIVFPVVTGPHFGAESQISDPDTTTATVTYIPRRDTLKRCQCVPGCPHSTATYYVSGWGR